MLLNNKPLILFSVLAIFFIGLMLYFILVTIADSVISQELGEMKGKLIEKQIRVETLNSRATEDIIFALKNPAFTEYFELSNTRTGNTFENDVLQFTLDQRELKTELEQWIWDFQNKFQVDETCIIDITGQEHARLVHQMIESDKLLSPNEEETPFFEPSFQKEKDEVHIQFPYISPDTHRWVFAYTSPIVLKDQSKPAIYHFEMPITVFQELITVDKGRMYVMDPKGFVMADSNYNNSFSNTFEKQFPSSNTILPDSVLLEMKNTGEGTITYQSTNDTFYLVYTTIPPFDWILIIEEPRSVMLSENNTLFGSVTNATIILFTLGILIGSIVITLLLASRITTGMVELGKITEDEKE